MAMPGFGCEKYYRIYQAVEKSRHCHLSGFLMGVGIPLMGEKNARELDEYFSGSWTGFEKAIQEGFSFQHIAGISEALSRNIYHWYRDEDEGHLWRPLLQELTFISKTPKNEGNCFLNRNVAVTGTVNGMNRQDVSELLKIMGACVSELVDHSTGYLIVGKNPDRKMLAEALRIGTEIILESQFADMIGECESS